jgi:hypothetical protein
MAPPTVDIAYARTPTVAIFTVDTVENVSAEENTQDEVVRLTVERVFKGNLKPGEKFDFQNEGLCILSFSKRSIGKRFLLYLGERPAKQSSWGAGLCSRSGSLNATADDVLYLEKRNKVIGKTRLSGMFSQQVEEDGDPRDWYFRSLPGHILRIRGNGKEITLKTDENGAYEVYGLAPGKYEILPAQISGFSPNHGDDPSEPTTVTIGPTKHTQENFYFEIDNSVSGTLVDSKQQPIAGVCLSLRPTNFTLPSYGEKGACTDIRGHFSFSNLLSGSYILVGNKDNQISPREPYPRFFYPGVLEESGASSFAMAPGVHFKKLVVSAPPTDDIVILSGTVKYDDGKPVVKAKIEFFAGISSKSEIKDSLSYSSWAETDDSGNFRLRVKKEQTGIAIASFTAHKREYKGCFQVLKIIEKGPLDWDDIETSPIKVNATNLDEVIELRYPFVACKNAK